VKESSVKESGVKESSVKESGPVPVEMRVRRRKREGVEERM
jgi:hypothetical protein